LAITNLLELGSAANQSRARLHADRVYFSRAALPVLAIHCPLAELDAALAQVPAGTRAVSVSIAAPEGATTGEADIRAIAQARLALPGVEHIAADWARLTPYVAQVALCFGASLITGIPEGTARKEVVRLIEDAGRAPFECDADFEAAEGVWESPLPVLHS